MNVKPCYSTSWLIWFGHSRALAFPPPSHSYFEHTLAQIAGIEALQCTANIENKPPLALENEKSQLNPVGTVFAGRNLSHRAILCLKLMRS